MKINIQGLKTTADNNEEHVYLPYPTREQLTQPFQIFVVDEVFGIPACKRAAENTLENKYGGRR